MRKKKKKMEEGKVRDKRGGRNHGRMEGRKKEGKSRKKE